MPLRKRSWYTQPLVLLSVLFLVLAVIVHSGPPTAIERLIFFWVNDLPQAWHGVMVAITYSGSLYGVLLVATGLLLAKRQWLALQLLGTSFVATVVVSIAKELVGRGRPTTVFDNVRIGISETGMGFPSGHTTEITIVAVLLATVLPRRLRYLMVLWIALVGVSRMYLGVHGPLDIVGGVLLGVILVMTSHKVMPFLHKKLVSKP